MFLKFFSAFAAVLVCAGLVSELDIPTESSMRREHSRTVLTDVVKDDGTSVITQTEQPLQSTVTIHLTPSEAEQAALDHALLQAHEVVFSRTEYDIDDGIPEWEIEFRHGDYEYDYTVHAESGLILRFDREYEPVWSSDRKQNPTEVQGRTDSAQQAPTVPAPTVPQTPSVEQASELTEAQAMEIALAHAGLRADEVKGLHAKRDRDDGITIFEISFRNGFTEYDYDIHAGNGSILEWDRDFGD